jgi:hypothetical protein
MHNGNIFLCPSTTELNPFLSTTHKNFGKENQKMGFVRPSPYYAHLKISVTEADAPPENCTCTLVTPFFTIVPLDNVVGR